MSSAVRRVVPLNSRCSRKCVAPASDRDSSREPTLVQRPRVAERAPGIVSVITRSPPGRTVRRTVDAVAPDGPPSAFSFRSVRVDPSGWSEAERYRMVVLRSGVRLLRLAVLDDRDERQLAAVVDLADLDLEL